MTRGSAGLLVFRRVPRLEVLLGHMGGPFWARKDAAAWSIPKGEHGPEEEPLTAARREFAEELGIPAPAGPALPLGEVRQSGGKSVSVWAVESDVDVGAVRPGTFRLEWPPGTGRIVDVPELDRVEWTPLEAARTRLVRAQVAFLDRLALSLE